MMPNQREPRFAENREFEIWKRHGNFKRGSSPGTPTVNFTSQQCGMKPLFLPLASS